MTIQLGRKTIIINFKYPIETETDERVWEENFSCNSFNATKFL